MNVLLPLDVISLSSIIALVIYNLTRINEWTSAAALLTLLMRRPLTVPIEDFDKLNSSNKCQFSLNDRSEIDKPQDIAGLAIKIAVMVEDFNLAFQFLEGND